jgi:signal transduction histidine kinase
MLESRAAADGPGGAPGLGRFPRGRMARVGRSNDEDMRRDGEPWPAGAGTPGRPRSRRGPRGGRRRPPAPSVVNRLLVRLLAASALSLAVALTTAGVIAHQRATAEFDRYLAARRLAVEQRVGPFLLAYHARFGWAGASAELEQLAAGSGDRIVLQAPGGGTIADSAPGQPLPAGVRPLRIDLVTDRPLGSVWIYPGAGPAPNRRVPPLSRQLGESLALAAAFGFLAALGVSLLMARGIARPIEAVTRAARRMALGQLDQRVPESGPGEVGELAAAFNAMAEAVSRSSRLRQDMVADVAHELRTPLTVMRGYIEALRDGVAPPDSENLGVIHAEAVHLQRLVEDLQELALAEAQQIDLQLETLSLEDLAQSVASGFRLAAEAKAVELDVEAEPGLPAVRADPRRIGQVLRNLLANAVAHTPAGGRITVGCRLAAGEAPPGRSKAPAAEVEVFVRDSGPGVAAEDQPWVFERFYRADRSRARATGGAGLGLTIARRLVEAHGGTIGLESDPGRGSTFWFRLPLQTRPVGQATPVRSG